LHLALAEGSQFVGLILEQGGQRLHSRGVQQLLQFRAPLTRLFRTLTFTAKPDLVPIEYLAHRELLPLTLGLQYNPHTQRQLPRLRFGVRRTTNPEVDHAPGPGLLRLHFGEFLLAAVRLDALFDDGANLVLSIKSVSRSYEKHSEPCHRRLPSHE